MMIKKFTEVINEFIEDRNEKTDGYWGKLEGIIHFKGTDKIMTINDDDSIKDVCCREVNNQPYRLITDEMNIEVKEYTVCAIVNRVEERQDFEFIIVNPKGSHDLYLRLAAMKVILD